MVRVAIAAFLFLLFSQMAPAQIASGLLDVIVSRRGVTVVVTGSPGFTVHAVSNANGEVKFLLPYGDYIVTGGGDRQRVHVAPLAVTHAVIQPGRVVEAVRRSPPQSFSLPAQLLMTSPGIVTDPLDFSGLQNNRLVRISLRGTSWTNTRYRLQGMDATDSYQPGVPVILADTHALDQVSLSEEPDIGVFIRNPGESWHGGLTTSDTGTGLTSDNLPPPSQRGEVLQPEGYRWFTNDHAETGGPITRRADVFLSGTSQWASQTVEQAQPGDDLSSRLLFANARGRVRLSSKDQLDAQYTGSRIDLSGWGFPAGLEALTGRRMGPSLYGVSGFPDLSEVDHMDFVQLGWTRVLPASSGAGMLQVRYGYSTAHLDTRPDRTISGPSVTDFTNPIGSGAPVWNLAVRTRHDFEATYEPSEIPAAGTRHRLAIGGGWQTAHPKNRYEAPFDENIIDATGIPAFVVQLNTPLDSRESIESFSPYIHDHATLTRWLSADAGLLADISRGGLPAQSSPAGLFTSARQFSPHPDIIAWNSIASRAGLALRVPHLPVVLRGSYARFERPLAGRYLDFANPNSIGGLEYSASTGQLLRRFGGPYSTVSPSLKRPYSDNFSVAAETSLPWRTSATVRLYRSDEKDRIAAINTGVPFSAYSPEVIDDPGPDFIPGTFDDQQITAYAQNPATFGQDHYLLTNPSGLRGLNEGFLAEIAARQRYATAKATFVAMKSFGPTNSGNSAFGNDLSVIGALLGDKNALINATGHAFFDRAYAGNLAIDSRLPFGGVEISSIINYFDGLPFARQLLVTALPQGPFLLPTTIRGSPEGGNRAEYVLNWNVRVSRDFALRFGALSVSANVFNVLNGNHSVEEEDISGPLFNQRLPIAIQPARFVRIGVGYRF